MSATAEALVAAALVAKIAGDLNDPALVRQAALEALRHARLLAGTASGAAGALPELEDLLEQRYPRTTEEEPA